MIYDHYSDFELFDEWRWKNFTPKELSCPCCGEYYHDPESLDLIQAARDAYGKPIHINSGHRCKKHNHTVGGAKNSEHLRIAFDCKIPTNGNNKRRLFQALYDGGFTTFGLYNTFIHVDKRPWRLWIMGNKRIWQTIYDDIVKRDD